MRLDIAGSRHGDQEVRETIKRVYETRGYLLDPHSAIAYLGLKQELRAPDRPAASHLARPSAERLGVFLATAHPAKFGEIVEPIIRRPIVTPAPLADALARPRHILRIDASLDAVTEALVA
jgi:threonine synthase